MGSNPTPGVPPGGWSPDHPYTGVEGAEPLFESHPRRSTPVISVKVLVSGRPGVGKTTLIERLSERVPGCGFYTEEVREEGRRVGFDFVRIGGNGRVPLARVGEGFPRVGRYVVFVENIDHALRWLEGCGGIVYVDEIGPMELTHPRFGPTVERVVRKASTFVGTVHRKVAKEWARKLGTELIWLTEENREEVFERLLTSLGLRGTRRSP